MMESTSSSTSSQPRSQRRQCRMLLILVGFLAVAFVSILMDAGFVHEFFGVVTSENKQATTLWKNSATHRSTTATKSNNQRLLLAIFSSESKTSDRQLRHLIRHTYLKFYTKIMPNLQPAHKNANYANLTICAWHEFWNATTATSSDDDCNIVYTFVIGKKPTNNKMAADVMVIDKAVYKVSSDEAKLSIPRLEMQMAWMEQVYNQSHSFFSHVALADARTIIYPSRLWPNGVTSIFHKSAPGEQQDAKTSNDSFRLACLGTNTLTSGENANSNNKKRCTSDRFLILSMSLVKHLVSFKRSIIQAEQSESTARLLDIVDAFPNATISILNDGGSSLPSNHEAQVRLLDGSINEYHTTFLDWWSIYQDSMAEFPSITPSATTTALPTDNGQHPPRMLLGIFSMLNDKLEMKRRATIRSTVLSYYKNTTSATPDRICSLSYFRQHYESIMREEDNVKCQLVYAFVVGSKDKESPDESPHKRKSNYSGEDLVEDYWTIPNLPLVRPPASGRNTTSQKNKEEDNDIVYLNIKENMNGGKSQSWFLYASRGIRAHDDSNTLIVFDYIAKMDTDTILYPPRLLDYALAQLPSFPNNAQIYGGAMLEIKTYQDSDTVAKLSGPYYMLGLFYFLSWDLARYVSSKECPRSTWDLHSEDKSMGNFVHTYTLPIRYQVSGHAPGGRHGSLNTTGSKKPYCLHPFKDVKKYKAAWTKYLAVKTFKEAKSQLSILK